MPTSGNDQHHVIIAGAGPVGLFLACELRLRACSVLVLEQAADPYTPSKELPFGLRGLSVPTIENLDRRDLLRTVQSGGSTGHTTPAAAQWRHQHRRPVGHFAGLQFFEDRIDTARWPFRLPGPVSGLAVDMASLETALAHRAQALGVTIRRGCALEGLERTDDGIAVRAGDDIFTATWLVGCDGGRSRVRKAAGIAFTGTEPEFTGYSVEVELAEAGGLEPGRTVTATGMYTYAPPGTIAMVAFDGGAFHRTVPITREHVEAVLRRVSGTKVVVQSLISATTWTDRAFQATTYRKGRVLLAGDAAHIHSPLGGQGLNLGLGDAMNLGWKLAASVHGTAPPELLDSYERERHPVAAQVLDWSRAQVALMRPSRSTRALRAIMGDLIDTRDGATYFAERSLGLGLRYDLGDGHPLAGRSVADFGLVDGARLNERLRSGRGILLDVADRASLREVAGRWSDRIDHLVGDAENRLGVTALLVRPDGVVAWASDDVASVDTVARVAERWFGKPAEPRAA